MKVSELNTYAIDWAVARCENLYDDHNKQAPQIFFDANYSTDWWVAGEIIEREMITITPADHEGWNAYAHPKQEAIWGDTPLVAAMRCYIRSRMGDDIEIPEELK